LVENNNENDTSGIDDSNINREQSPEDNPFLNGNIEEPSAGENKKAGHEFGGNLDFLVFLILILLLMGNTNSFNNHFQLINSEVEKITKLLEAVSVTNDNLQNAVKAPQKVMQSFDGLNN